MPNQSLGIGTSLPRLMNFRLFLLLISIRKLRPNQYAAYFAPKLVGWCLRSQFFISTPWHTFQHLPFPYRRSKNLQHFFLFCFVFSFKQKMRRFKQKIPILYFFVYLFSTKLALATGWIRKCEFGLYFFWILSLVFFSFFRRHWLH